MFNPYKRDYKDFLQQKQKRNPVFFEEEYDRQHMLTRGRTNVYHIKPSLRRKGYSQKSISICIPLIIAHIDWAPGIWIYFNRSSVTSDSNEVHYLGGGIRSEGCVCVEGPGDTGRQTHTHTHTHHITKNTSHLPHCVPAETETTQLAVPSLCLCCVFTTQRQMVSWHRSTLMSLGGSAGSTFISAVLFQFTTTSRCTHMHTKKRQRGTKNSLTP